MIFDNEPSTGMPKRLWALNPWPSKFPKCLSDHIWSRHDRDLWPFDLKT